MLGESHAGNLAQKLGPHLLLQRPKVQLRGPRRGLQSTGVSSPRGLYVIFQALLGPAVYLYSEHRHVESYSQNLFCIFKDEAVFSRREDVALLE